METWILAVSGGVDSVTMLHKMSQLADRQYVVAHVDHGIREESGEDAAFVEELAARYGFRYESTCLQLGAGTSEETARDKRWQFLRSVQKKYDATAIATGHHADDVVETIIINLMRGTGWRGLVSLREHEELKRPLINLRKSEVIEYASKHNLAWHEDVTNTDNSYLRNYVRHHVLPCCSQEAFSHFLHLHHETLELLPEIDREVETLVSQEIGRYEMIMWPDEVTREVLRACLGPLTRIEMDSVLLFVRTAKVHKTKQISGGVRLKTTVNQFIVIRGDN